MEPIWSYGQIFPPSLVDLIENTSPNVEEFEEEDIDYDEILEYLDDDDDEESIYDNMVIS